MHWFEPTEKFFEIARVFQEQKKVIIDCGCGVGYTLYKLQQQGIGALGIEFMKQTPIISGLHILVMDVCDYKFKSEQVALIARPCRGEWIHKTMSNAIAGGASVIYCGLKRHYVSDIVCLPPHLCATLLSDNVGLAGEDCYRITGA